MSPLPRLLVFNLTTWRHPQWDAALIDSAPLAQGRLIRLKKVDGRWIERHLIAAWSS
jgi:hypothetical protein